MFNLPQGNVHGQKRLQARLVLQVELGLGTKLVGWFSSTKYKQNKGDKPSKAALRLATLDNTEASRFHQQSSVKALHFSIDINQSIFTSQFQTAFAQQRRLDSNVEN